MLEPGLGIHLGLLDTSPYSVTDPHAQLAPEDLALLEVRISQDCDDQICLAQGILVISFVSMTKIC